LNGTFWSHLQVAIEKYPELEVETYLMALDGSVETDGGHV
jgi:hypothetical protein